ncbi:FADR184Wp [Eremothecium gossypii FDAG1]|nr:FADR184Wp [Eremothecium gossypii FDAG1]
MLRFQRTVPRVAIRRLANVYSEGAVLHGYKVRRAQEIPEMRMAAVELEHEMTGARHLHLEREDQNNVFSVGFRTPPPDATGVPHILEHTTLCGSQKYPVRDPFFKMLNRSLANFMNAMTAHDHTFYPFATTNQKDFANLRDLYLDATLRPLLRHADFLQEGWRLEHRDVGDASSELVFKGVVYNEMKGQVSNADYYFWIRFQEAIYPALHNSGGDPEHITDLSYEDLVAFHQNHYHPSNAKTFTYGNFPLRDTLRKLDDEFRGFGRRAIPQMHEKPLQLREAVSVEEPCQIDPMLPADKQCRTSMTWICGNPNDVYETFLLKILGSLLFDGHSSAFYKKLVEETGLAYELSVNTGVESQTAANFLTVGVQGCTDVGQVHKVIMETFTALLAQPFEKHRVEAILHQLELSKKDQKSDFGLQLLYGILPGWVNNTDPFDLLSLNSALQRFRADWDREGDGLFQRLLNKYVIGKPSFTFTMVGSSDFNQVKDQNEQSKLKAKVSSLTESDKEVIYKRGLHLQELQNSEQDLSKLPTLTTADIPHSSGHYFVSRDGPITTRQTDTNGITYIRMKRPLKGAIPYDAYPYIPLYSDGLMNIGTLLEDASAIEEQIRLHTGGISVSIGVHPNVETRLPELYLEISACALNSKTQYVFDIINKIMNETALSVRSEKMKVLIRAAASSFTSYAAENGHDLARLHTGAHFSQTQAIMEQTAGIEQVRHMNNLMSIIDKEAEFNTVLQNLEAMHRKIFVADGLEVMITTDNRQTSDVVKDQALKFIAGVQQSAGAESWLPEKYSRRPLEKPYPALLQFPFQVHYTAQSTQGVSYTHPDGAHLQVLASLLTFKHLHREVREKGGAYGGGATYNATDGIFNFFSYRDPQPVRSLNIFRNAGKYVLNEARWTADDLNEAKLSIFQRVDAPISPSSEGLLQFRHNISDEQRDRRRQQLLKSTLDDVRRVADIYLVQPSPSQHMSAVVGPELPREVWSSQWPVIKV